MVKLRWILYYLREKKMNKIKREKTGNKYDSYNIRLSQLITTYGPGGIVDFEDQPLMVADLTIGQSIILYTMRDQKKYWVQMNLDYIKMIQKIMEQGFHL